MLAPLKWKHRSFRGRKVLATTGRVVAGTKSPRNEEMSTSRPNPALFHWYFFEEPDAPERATESVSQLSPSSTDSYKGSYFKYGKNVNSVKTIPDSALIAETTTASSTVLPNNYPAPFFNYPASDFGYVQLSQAPAQAFPEYSSPSNPYTPQNDYGWISTLDHNAPETPKFPDLKVVQKLFEALGPVLFPLPFILASIPFLISIIPLSILASSIRNPDSIATIPPGNFTVIPKPFPVESFMPAKTTKPPPTMPSNINGTSSTESSSGIPESGSSSSSGNHSHPDQQFPSKPEFPGQPQFPSFPGQQFPGQNFSNFPPPQTLPEKPDQQLPAFPTQPPNQQRPPQTNPGSPPNQQRPPQTNPGSPPNQQRPPSSGNNNGQFPGFPQFPNYPKPNDSTRTGMNNATTLTGSVTPYQVVSSVYLNSTSKPPPSTIIINPQKNTEEIHDLKKFLLKFSFPSEPPGNKVFSEFVSSSFPLIFLNDTYDNFYLRMKAKVRN